MTSSWLGTTNTFCPPAPTIEYAVSGSGQSCVRLSQKKSSYSGFSGTATAGMLLLQMVAAIAGAWIADRRALRGEDLPGERLG